MIAPIVGLSTVHSVEAYEIPDCNDYPERTEHWGFFTPENSVYVTDDVKVELTDYQKEVLRTRPLKFYKFDEHNADDES